MRTIESRCGLLFLALPLLLFAHAACRPGQRGEPAETSAALEAGKLSAEPSSEMSITIAPEIAEVLAQDPEPFAESVRRLYLECNFEKLEAIAVAARQTRAKYADHTAKINHLYEALAVLQQGLPDDKRPEYIASLGKWAQADVKSLTARVALMRAYIDGAWKARGEDWAYEVSAEGWEGFRKNLDKAKAVAEEIRASGEKDSMFFKQMITLCTGLGTKRSVVDACYEEGIRLDPEDLDLTDAAVMYYLPRWHGEPGDLVALAERAVDLTRERLGEALYFYTASCVFPWERAPATLEEHGFSWERIDKGYGDFRRNFTDEPSYADMACLFACLAGRRDRAKEYFNAIGETPSATNWTKAGFNAWKKWANGEGPPLQVLPLHEAARRQDGAQVVDLLKSGADPNQIDYVGYSPLGVAARYNDCESMLVLLEHGADPSNMDAQVRPPLLIAAQNNRPDLVIALLKHGAAPGAAYAGWTPLHAAAHSGYDEIVRLLMARPDCDVNASDDFSWTPLNAAAFTGSTGVVKLLLQRAECDVNHITKSGATPLCSAVDKGYIETLRLLLDRTDCNVNLCIENVAESPLQVAAHRNQVDAAKLLLEKGADPNLYVPPHDTALAAAVSDESEGMVDLLLERGADANFKQIHDWTALHEAAGSGSLSILKKLWSFPKIDRNPITSDGRTLLIQAATCGQIENVKFLVESGQDINSRDGSGKTALAKAKEKGYSNVVEFLQQRGGVE